MVKSMKKAIAVLISVLMIVSSMPFTALTASAAVSIPSNLSAQTANAKPESFNAVGKLSSANAPDGTYSNLVYQGTDKDEKGEDKDYLGHGVITQKKTVIVYDGVHEASAPVYAKFWPTGSSDVQLCYTYISNSKPVALNEWVGSYKTNTSTPTLPYNPNGNTLLNYKSHDANRLSFTSSDHSKCGSGEAWIFWTGQRYTGVGNTTDYYEKISGVTYQTGHRNKYWGSWNNRTYNYTPSADVYVLNYKPVYEVLNNTAKVKVNETNTEYTFKDLFNTVWGNENSYTTDSLQAYYNAVSRLVSLNVNNYFSGANDSNVEAQTQSAANAIKSVYNDYVAAVNGLKRQYKVTIVDANDVVKATGYFEAGTDVSAYVNKYLPANTYDALKHYNYSWTPAISVVSADVTYKVTVSSGNHSMQNNGEPTKATCTEDGSQPTKCGACDYTSATTLTKLGHSYTIYLNAYTTNSDYDESATYQHAAGCNNDGCGEVDYKDCTFGAWTTVDGDSTKEFKRCTVCGGQVVRDKAIDKITITFELPNGTVVDSKTVDVNAEVDAPSLDAYATIDEEGHHSYSWEQATYSSATDTTITATADEVVAHAYGEYVDDDNATCTTNGTKTAKCTVSADCTFDDVKTIDDSAKGHSWVNPTENLDDTHTFTCENGCGEVKTEDCSFTVEKEKVPATCTEDGYVINACETCGKEKQTSQKSTGHSYSAVVTDPTCTEDGYTTYTCAVCTVSYKADYEDATGHAWSKSVVEATCTENAYTISACANCEETKDKTDLYVLTEVKDIDDSVNYLDIKGNNKQVAEFDLGFDVEEVTFTFSCHTYNGWLSDSKIYVYDYAGNQLKSYDANSLMENQTITLHNTRAYIKVDYQPTDDKDYFTVSSVKVLDSQFKALDHNYTVDLGNGYAATCTEDGKNADMQCSRCDAVQTGTTIGKLGHSFTNYVSNNDATCTEDGTKTATCDRDGCEVTDTVEDTGSKLGHNMQDVPGTAVDATCTEDGKNADKKCSRCEEFTEGTTIGKLGHDMQDVPGTAVDATCTEDGKNADKKCSRCEEFTEGTTIGKLGHSFTIEQSSTTATCVTVGSVTYSCANGCSETYTEYGTKNADNHENVVTDEAVDATCTETGLTEGSHCEACSTTIVAQEEVSVLGHNYTEEVADTAKAATCTEDGKYADMKCSRCEDVQTGETIEKLGHSFTNYVTNDDAVTATCVTEGMTASQTATCDRDGCSVTDKIPGTSTGLDADNHKGEVALDESTVVEATAEEDGYTGDKICDACNEVAEAGTVVPALGYTITFKKSSTVLGTKTYAVNTPAADVYADAKEMMADYTTSLSTSSVHYYWKESTFVDVTADKTYSMTSANHVSMFENEYEGEDETGVTIIRTCPVCSYQDTQEAVAKVNGNYYSTLFSAINESTSKDDVVTLIKDVENETACKSATVDLNGHTISCTKNTGALEIKMLAGTSVDDTIELTIKNGNIVNDASDKVGILVQRSNVVLNLEDVNFNTVNNCVYIYDTFRFSLKNYTIDNVVVNVKSGNFESSATPKFVLNKKAGATDDCYFEVSGGSFKNYNPAMSTSGAGESKLAEGYCWTEATEGDDTVYTVVDHHTEAEAVQEKEVPATFREDGSYDEVVYCQYCDTELSREQKTTDKTGDFTAYYAAVEEVATVVTDGKTAVSIEAFNAEVAAAKAAGEAAMDKDSLDAATARLLEAYKLLEDIVEEYTVTVVVNYSDKEEVAEKTYTGVYGTAITVDVTDMTSGYSIKKWTVTQGDSTSKLSYTNTVYDMIITDDRTIDIYVDKDVENAKENGYSKIVVLDRNNKKIGSGYVENTTSVDTNANGMITAESLSDVLAEVEAPRLAFYNFVGWEIVTGDLSADGEVTSNITVVARYEAPAPTCRIHFVGDLQFVDIDGTVYTNGDTYNAYYDQELPIESANDIAIATNAQLKDAIYLRDKNSVHTPHASEAWIFVVKDMERVVPVAVTGIYNDVDGALTIAGFNLAASLPEDCTLIECGVYYAGSPDANIGAAYDIDVTTAKKVRSTKQTNNGEFTIEIASKKAFAGTKTVYALPYVTYTDAAGNIQTEYGTVVGNTVNQ